MKTQMQDTINTSSINIYNLVAQAYKETDEYVELLTQKAASQTPPITVACKAGCAACCSYIVTGDHAECIVIAAAIQAKPQQERERMLGRLMTWVQQWGIHSHNDVYGAPGPNVIEWQAKRKACPFLSPSNHLCMIYEVRPIACRAYHACTPTETDVNPCEKCPIPKPPQDCFTTQTHVKHNHAPWVYQMDNNLITDFSLRLAALTGVLELGVMPVLVWNIGMRKYGWSSRKIKMRPLYKLESPFAQ